MVQSVFVFRKFWNVVAAGAFAAGCFSVSAYAQYFEDESMGRQISSSQAGSANAGRAAASSSSQAGRSNTSATGRSATYTSSSNPNARRNYLTGKSDSSQQPISVPVTATGQSKSSGRTIQTLTPTLDGVARGHVSMGQVVRGQNGGFEVSEYASIFLFYDKFGIRRSISGSVSCDVRFIVLSTLDRKLTNLSVKLKWPAMETALNFSDVAPNVENYFDYSLVGDGCYSMDKIPNVIVNRCRVVGMSEKECAGKIKWLKKGM